ncbi:cold-shock protein, partial [Vibrio parahaemolyticus]
MIYGKWGEIMKGIIVRWVDDRGFGFI